MAVQVGGRRDEMARYFVAEIVDFRDCAASVLKELGMAECGDEELKIRELGKRVWIHARRVKNSAAIMRERDLIEFCAELETEFRALESKDVIEFTSYTSRLHDAVNRLSRDVEGFRIQYAVRE